MPRDASTPLIVVSDAQALGDDGAALALLFASRAVERITLVAASGNVWAGEAYTNLCNIVARFGRSDVPILHGLSAQRHCARVAYFDENERQRTDLRFAGALHMPPPDSKVDDANALNVFIETIEASEKPDILLLAPATIVQDTITLRPDIDSRVNRIYAIGGAISVPGNSTPQAEFNFWFDPQAADALLASNLPLTLLPLDALDGLAYPRGMVGTAKAEASYIAEYAARRKGAATPMWDEALVAAYLWPTLIRRCTDLGLGAVTTPGADYGALREAAERRQVQTVTELDRGALATRFGELLGGA